MTIPCPYKRWDGDPEEYDAGISPLGGCCYRADLDGNFLVSSQNGNFTASDQFCDDVLYFLPCAVLCIWTALWIVMMRLCRGGLWRSGRES